MACLFNSCPYNAEEPTGFETEAPCAILMDQNTGRVLFEKNSHDVKNSASLMKIMNLLLAIESIENGEIEENDNTTISDEAASVKGMNVWLKSGENVTVGDLIKSIAMVSANDASVALAQHMEKSEGKFVARMNQRASELQMKNTIFKDCIGSDEDGNVTSAYDIALMSRELMKHKNILPYTSTWIDHIRNSQTQLVNTNKLLKTYGGTTGLKTGTTEKAGSCMVATAEKNGMKLIGVVLECRDPKERLKEITKILDHGFSDYVTITLNIPEELPKFIQVKNGMISKIEIHIPPAESVLVPKQNTANISSELNISEEITAPVEPNQKIGEIIFTQGNETLYKYDITTKSKVDEINFNSVLKNLTTDFFRL